MFIATALTPKSSPILGSAVAITVPSSISMKKAPATSHVTARALAQSAGRSIVSDVVSLIGAGFGGGFRDGQ